ncbi:MAG: hypothetical protein WCJ59_01345 [bacterium]
MSDKPYKEDFSAEAILQREKLHERHFKRHEISGWKKILVLVIATLISIGLFLAVYSMTLPK